LFELNCLRTIFLISRDIVEFYAVGTFLSSWFKDYYLLGGSKGGKWMTRPHHILVS
jgi:hypothetical protein